MRQRIAFGLIMGVITTGIISFTLISVNIGFVEKFLSIWLRSWAMSYTVVIPCILLIGPKVQALVNTTFPEKAMVEEE
ncbi:DUF2798 domain-containing protein [Emticicia sp. C21]|uniref:DUF2798 domain-containing protein n=1 Tax=Emticicia sp. C21 TaxID=2302915 RepID=UPI000E3563C7|nr:DUF2798 domain-containing protein [Emticicia sp. C21]RFS14338.1 DUF2798 domain-containing protein [Emticicia sp. C21]